MACFLVPMGTAIIITPAKKRIPERYHFHWLISMLWGGVVMLCVEHISHGEVVPYPPFLTKGLSEVIPEMVRVGVPMTLAVFVVWLIMVGVANWFEKIKERKLVETY